MDLDERDLKRTRGVWASRLKEDPQWGEFIGAIYEAQFAKWLASGSASVEEREAIYWMMRGAREMEDTLRIYSDDLKMIEDDDQREENNE